MFYFYHPFSLFPICSSLSVFLSSISFSPSYVCLISTLAFFILVTFVLCFFSFLFIWLHHLFFCSSSLLFVTPTSSNLFQMFLKVSLFFFLLVIILLSSSLFFLFVSSSLLSALSSPVWHPHSTTVFSSNLLALYWSYQPSGVFCRPYLLVSVCVFVFSCMFVWVSCRKKKMRRESGALPTPPVLRLCFTFSSPLSFLPFFLACSPPLHQGRSSPAAEIQFRSSSSSFLCLHQLKRWAHTILSPSRLSDWATRSRFLPLVSMLFYQDATVVY